jgi:hypothetical protein
MSSDETQILICGWCRTELPSIGDWMVDNVEVHHHFLTAHNEPVSYSVQCVYPDRVEAEFQEWLNRLVAAEQRLGLDRP